MGSPASTGSAQFPLLLLILLLFVGLHLSGAQSPAPAPALVPSPAVDAIAPTPVSPVNVFPPPVPAAVASPFSFSFDFTNNSNYRHDDLKFEGHAVAQTQLVDLGTCDGSSDCMRVGRVSYAHPVPFYDSTTGGGEMASFQTRFTFGILSNNKNAKGEGMAFFLAYFNSTFQGDSSSGSGGLGLMVGDGASLDTDQFVAVEFDTFQDTWDPIGDHIGIDINSVASPNYNASLPFDLSGYMMATITFENTTRTLVADLQFAYPDGNYRPDHGVVSGQLPVTLSSLLPAQVAVGFSAATSPRSGMVQHQILSWSFNSSLALPEKVHNMKPAFIGGSIGGAVALVVVVWCILSCFRWKKSTRSHDFVTRTGGPRQFDYRDLAVATGNFSAERVIGRGAFGVVYRGTLISKGSSSSSSSSSGVHSRESDALSSMESGASSNPSSKESDGGEVAVKKILNEPRGGNLDFFAEMSAISAAKHKNLVKLKGWCCKGNSQNMFDFMCWCYRKKKDDELFLVYELVPNGNLHYHLRESEQVIAWPTRYQIIKDIGSALVYLHHDCAPYILHRDIKPSNILLDNNFNAKLADFGLSRIGNQDNATLLTTAIGTEGYIDPECRKDGKVKFYRSSDVYSFGIVLLDIVCTGKSRERVWELYIRSRVMEATDGRLHGGDDDLDRNQMQRVAVLGLWCSLSESAKRPTVRKAMEVLERDEPLPDLDYLVKTSVPSAQQGTCTISSDQHALKSDGT
ncbi:L-type lectin-domain containing receptor kinase IX.1-like [Hordeum vulgare subsp. vulgare]|nr:L-type lectin-domain containing receptor kinase IX.1-like [Hordeum vulgare subsp. vulgare]